MASLLEIVLTRAGHDVKAACSIAEALAALDETTDLLVADVLMPDGNGVDLADDAQRRLPALHVLFVTGSAPAPEGIRNRPLLLKPFLLKDLVDSANYALRAGLEGSASLPVRIASGSSLASP